MTIPPAQALADAYRTWPPDVRPKVHLSSPRVDLEIAERKPAGSRRTERVPVTPRLTPHADFIAELEGDIVDGTPVPPVGAGEVAAILDRYNNEVLFEQMTPEDAAVAFRADVEAAIG